VPAPAGIHDDVVDVAAGIAQLLSTTAARGQRTRSRRGRHVAPRRRSPHPRVRAECRGTMRSRPRGWPPGDMKALRVVLVMLSHQRGAEAAEHRKICAVARRMTDVRKVHGLRS
jgi:hypothetical protein